ncbi:MULTISPECIES: hypothetical protein [unclassified Stenotrophomonas]|uniref:hypothetical protein n=1 Tax=unclassified Stenotrophomonas TaxID=196198 RepID=UPI003BF8E46E
MQARKLTLVEIGVGGLPSASPVAPRFSTWFPVPFKAPDVPPANGVNPTPVADGVVLEWDAVDLEGVIYVISRSESQDGPWTEIHRTTETRYVYSDGSGKTWWFQITPTVRGKAGTGTVVGVVPPTTSKDLAEQQAKLAAEISARIQAIADEAAARAAGLAQAAQDLVAEALLRQQGVTEAMQAISAEAQARIDALLNEKMAREAAISREEQLRQSADESLARAVSEVAAGSGTQFDSIKLWPFNQTIEGWTGNGAPTLVDGWLRPANHATAPWVQSPVALAVDGSAYRFVKLRVKRVGSPTWNGFLQWITTTDQAWNTQKRVAIPEPAWDVNGVATVDVQDIAWWPATVDAIRLQLGAAQTVANYYLIDYIAVGRPQPGASVALVQEETQARITADAAEALQRNTLAVQMRGNYTGTDPLQLTAGLAYEELKARVAADSAQVQRISTMEARMPAGAGSLATAASVTALQEATATTTSALAQSITTINATLPALISQGSNMVLNGSWDQGNTVGWSYSNMGGVSIVAEGRNGKCLKVTAPSGSRSMTANGATDRNIPVVIGKKYRISAYYKTDAAYNGTSGNGKIRIANQDDGLIAGLAFAANRTEWTRLESTVTATTISALRVYVNSDHTAGTLWVDDVVLEEVTELLANAQAISDLSTSVTQLGDTLTSQAGQLTSLRSDLTSVSGKTDANASALQNLTTRVTTAEGKIDSTSTSITKLQSDLSTSILSGANLIQDGSFETRKAGDAYGIGRITDTFARSGTKALSLTATGAIRDVSLIEFRTNGSRVFYAEVWVRNDPANPLTTGSGDGTVGLQATVRRNNGTVAYPNVQVIPAKNVGSEWTKLSGYVPVGDDVWSFIVRATIRGGVTSGDVIYDDAFVIDVTDAYTAQQGVNATADAVTGLTTRVTGAENKAAAQAEQLTVLSSTLNASFNRGENLNVNAMFDGDMAPFVKGNSNQQNGDVTWVSGGGQQGSAIQMVHKAGAAGSPFVYANGGRWVPLKTGRAGRKLRTVVVAKVVGGSATLTARCRARDATGEGNNDQTTPNLTSAWQRFVLEHPVGDARTEVMSQVWITNRGTGDATVLVDRIEFYDVTDELLISANASATAGLTTAVNQQGSKLDATAQDLVSLKTQVGDVSASGFNQLKTQVTQQGQTQASQAQQITGIQTSLGGKADATVVQQMEASIGVTGGSPNLLRNAGFTSFDGWDGWYSPGNIGIGAKYAAHFTTDGGIPWGMWGLIFVGANGAGNALVWQQDVPIEAGKDYIFSTYGSGSMWGLELVMVFLNASGNSVGEARCPMVKPLPAGGNTLSGYARLWVRGRAPSDAVAVRPHFVYSVGPGETGGFIRIVQPQLEAATPGQTWPSAFNIGGMESKASWNVSVRSDGKVAGVRLATNNGISAFDVVADMFRVSSSGAGQRTEYSDGNWRTYYPNGQLATRMGWWA